MSIRRHTLYNFFGTILPLATSLVTVPIYLRLVGETRYGILAIVWLLLGYFGLFDLGLGRATAQRIAALQEGTPTDRAHTFWTALILNVSLGGVGGLIIWPVAAYFFRHVFKIDEALRPEILAAVPWLIMAVPMATLTGVLTGALQGRGRFLELNLISVTGTLLFQILPLIVARYLGVSLGVLVPVALLARVLTVTVLFFQCWRNVFNGHKIVYEHEKAGDLLRLGGWITVSSFVSPMMVILDRFIIGSLFGAKAISWYTVPFQLAERTTIISTSHTAALFPHLAAATIDKEKQLIDNALRTIMAITTPLISIGILLMTPFLAWWITPDFAQRSSLVGRILLMGFWANGLAAIPYSLLQARGRPDIVAKCHVSELIPYFILLYIGLYTNGIIGAAIVFSVRVLVDLVLLGSVSGILKRSLHLFLVPSILLVIAFIIASEISSGRTGWYLIGLIHIVISVFLSWRINPGQKKNID